MNVKKLEKYLRVNLLRPGPCFIKKEFTGPRSQRLRNTVLSNCNKYRFMVTNFRCVVLAQLRAHWLRVLWRNGECGKISRREEGRLDFLFYRRRSMDETWKIVGWS